MSQLPQTLVDLLLAQFRRQHRPEILAPCATLVETITQQKIEVIAVDSLNSLTPAAKEYIRGSFCTGNTIVIVGQSISGQASDCNLDYAVALEGVLKHELAHLAGNESETAAWDNCQPSPTCPQWAIDRLRMNALLGSTYSPDRVEYVKPAWVERFDTLARSLGVQAAWIATAPARASLSNEDILSGLHRSLALPFNQAWDLVYGDQAECDRALLNLSLRSEYLRASLVKK